MIDRAGIGRHLLFRGLTVVSALIRSRPIFSTAWKPTTPAATAMRWRNGARLPSTDIWTDGGDCRPLQRGRRRAPGSGEGSHVVQEGGGLRPSGGATQPRRSLHGRGLGVPRDPVAAHLYLSRAGRKVSDWAATAERGERADERPPRRRRRRRAWATVGPDSSPEATKNSAD